MKPTLDDILNGIPEQSGNGGKPLSPTKKADARSETQLDKISASAKRLLTEEAEQRADKIARLRAARRALGRDDNT